MIAKITVMQNRVQCLCPTSGSLGNVLGILVGTMVLALIGNQSDISKVNTDFHAK